MIRLLRALAPGLAVVAGTLLLFLLVPERLEWLVSTYGIVVYLAGLALAWVFHRSRAFVVLVLLGGLDLFAVGGQGSSPLSDLLGPLVLDAAGRPEVARVLGTTALAILGLLSFVRDRGVGSRIGMMQVLCVAVVVVLAGLLATSPSAVEPLVTRAEAAGLLSTTWPGLPRITLFVAFFAAAGIAYALQRYRGAIERGLMWCALFVLGAMLEPVVAEHASVFLMAGGVTMTLAVVETSYVMAYRDELTGLPGRRALSQYLDGIQGTYTIAMVDVDHFKKFNDKHGHDVGDQVLKLVASRLAEAPGGGKAYRYGGEEFTLVYPGRVREDALPHLESVRESVEEARFTLRSWRRPRKKPDDSKAKKKKKKRKRSPKKLSVTVSIGMADTTGKLSDVASVLKKADKALYRAKKKGRNQVSK